MINGIIQSGQEIVTDGLVLHLDAAQLRSYPTTGTTWTDLSGVGNNGTLTNGPTFNSQFGGGIVLDGVNDYVRYPMINYAAETVMVWTKSNTVNYNKDAYISSSRFNNGHIIHPFVNGKNGAIYLLTSTGGNIVVSGYSLANITIPHFFCYTTNGSNLHIAYIDGAEIGRSTTAITRTTLAAVTTDLGFDNVPGSRYGNANYYIALRYNRALTATEVLQNYNATKSRFGL